jgi:hypothetical protein
MKWKMAKAWHPSSPSEQGGSETPSRGVVPFARIMAKRNNPIEADRHTIGSQFKLRGGTSN